MGTRQSKLSYETYDKVKLKIPPTVIESIHIYNSDHKNKYQLMYKLLDSIFNMGFGYYGRYNEAFVCGLSTGYLVYMRQLYNDKLEENIIREKLISYLENMIFSINNSEIEV